MLSEENLDSYMIVLILSQPKGPHIHANSSYLFTKDALGKINKSVDHMGGAVQLLVYLLIYIGTFT